MMALNHMQRLEDLYVAVPVALCVQLDLINNAKIFLKNDIKCFKGLDGLAGMDGCIHAAYLSHK